MTALFSDLRYAARVLGRAPLFTGVAVLTLALGIGANTAVFSVVNAVLLRPLPYEEGDRLALVWTNFGPDLPQNWISGPELVEMQEFATRFEAIGTALPFTLNVTGDGDPEQVPTAAVSGKLFEVLRVKATRGRLIGVDDDEPGSPPVAVLSHGLWQRRFGADPEIVGRRLTADGVPLEVVGVLPSDFSILHPDAQFPSAIDLWISMAPVITLSGAGSYAELPRGSHGMRGFARLKPGVSLTQAQEDMDAVARAIQAKTPDYYDFEGWGITVIGLYEDLVEEVRTPLAVLLGAVGFVLLIACVNVANLMLVRAAGQTREIALRRALGAGAWRLLRQLLAESLLLALAGGVLGVLLAWLLIRSLAGLVPADLPRAADIGVDGGVLAFTLVLALATGILFGLAPALYAARRDLAAAFKDGTRNAAAGAGGRRMRAMLVQIEVALALVLLIGAGLLIKSFSRLLETDPGFRPEQLLTMSINLPVSKSGDQAVRFWDQLLERVEALPGVTGAGAISELPLSGAYASGTTRVKASDTVPEGERAVEIDRRRVSPDYFETMGMRLLAGRTFDADDRADRPLVAIVDEQFVLRFWPTEDPIGQRVSINRDETGTPIWRQVVGVVAHSRHYGLDTVGREQAYFPYAQSPPSRMYLSVRSVLEPASLAPAVRAEVWGIDADQPVADVRPMAERVTAAVSQPRFNVLLLSGFALLALVLAAVGIYGVLSYAASQRYQELGVRMALGAGSGQVLGLLLAEGLRLVAIGLAVGTVIALALNRVLRGLLFEVEPTDPATYAWVALLLLTVAALACLAPAVRASRLQPARVLRDE